ncbi:unnamed protein product [Ceutorhynchus assimilis]|uniref:Ionotropic receptor n=1 Tax=Ceutorhynchus assimilis TaxID=467358 RepID=A0A9N9MX06_9CUCU|nr:unnamed protein product [Ceutorhynchus assimilis]
MPSNSLLEDYKIYAKYTRPQGRYWTCDITQNKNFGACVEDITAFLKATKCPKLIYPEKKTDLYVETFKTVSMHFLDKEDNFEDLIQGIVTSKYFNNRGRQKFLFCHTIEDDLTIMNLLELLWKYSLLNSVVVYHNETIHSGFYNPFSNELKLINGKKLQETVDEYPNKLKNMYGYPVNIIVGQNLTSLEPRYDYDVIFLESFKKITNCTLVSHLYPLDTLKFPQIVLEIVEKNAEFSPVTQPYSTEETENELSGEISCSYPHMMNDIVALVPKPKIVPNNFVDEAAAPWAILIYFLIIILVTLFEKHLSLTKRHYDIISFIAIGLRSSTPAFAKQKSCIKYFWILTCFFLWAYIEVKLLNRIMIPQYGNSIRTLDELRHSNLTVYTYRNYDSLGMNYTILTLTNFRELIFKNSVDAAFIGSFKTLDSYKIKYLNRNIKFKYELMPELLIPKYGCYFMKKKSIVHSTIQELLLHVKELGVKEDVPVRYKQQFNVENDLSLIQLELAFRGLLIGESFGIFVFLCEIALWNLKRFRNKFNKHM